MQQTPATADGFPDLLRRLRRQRRISQLDLALRARTTQRYLSFVEQGRSTPGRDVVSRLGEAMELSLRQRNELFTAAGYAPVFAESAPDDTAIQPTREALEHILAGHLPYPAFVVRPGGDVLLANSAFDALVGHVDAELLAPPVNVARVLLHPHGLAPRIANLGQWSRHVLDGLERRHRRQPDERLRVTIDEVTEYVRAVPEHPDPTGTTVPLQLRHPTAGLLLLVTTTTTLATAIDITLAEVFLEAFLPADRATDTALTDLTRGRSADLSKLGLWSRLKRRSPDRTSS